MNLLLALAVMQSAFPTPQAIAAMPTPEAAALLLGRSPPDLVSHRIVTDPAGGFVAVRFMATAQSAGEGLCRRVTYRVSAGEVARIRAGGPPATPRAKDQIALGNACGALRDSNFAWVQGPGATIETAGTMLRWLADLQRRARSGGPLAAAIMCRESRLTPDPCTAGAEAVLAALPLDRTYIIERGGTPGAWGLSVMPAGPGQLFYHVVLGCDDKDRPTVTIRWEAPKPF